MSQRRRRLNLPPGDVAHHESEDSTERHQNPEGSVEEVVKVEDGAEFSVEKHQREEEDEGVQIVVHRQTPQTIADRGEHSGIDFFYSEKLENSNFGVKNGIFRDIPWKNLNFRAFLLRK
ncbi:hypothetical protein GCK72_017126 [Caenorhabditis remanei]|uniref:Uncharacterized protein n=1 Tax=Caenorhabditis remanei TaxID=31234 RepID=A0A6A5G7D3_CAERE|nr:hypothetical protein GCK72_017126 [Caenorhabditis remanei]KAF1750575.1 hypothetical protein GCK72_017126 [Caenorhabditis remanei]